MGTNGTADLAQVAAVVLETDGTISILREGAQEATASTLVGSMVSNHRGERVTGFVPHLIRPDRTSP
jgi:uncharacterized membrane protein YcaP (DUF421 family)